MLPNLSVRLQRLVVRLMFASCLAGLVALTIWGENGLVDWYHLRRQVDVERAEWARLERENQRMLYELRRLEEDPIHAERMVAEELGWSREGAVIYTFED